MVLRIAGDVVAVINFMLQMSQSGTAALEFIDESKVAWTVEADAGTATATLFMDGVPVEQISLE